VNGDQHSEIIRREDEGEEFIEGRRKCNDEKRQTHEAGLI